MLKKATEDYIDIWKNEKGANFEWWILTWTLKNHKNLHFNRILLPKTYNVWAKKIADKLCLMALKIGAKFEGKLACAFQNDIWIWQIFIHRLKNSYFILKQLNLFTTFTKYSKVNLWQGLNICWVWNISGFWAFQDCQYAKVLNFQGYTEYLFL